MDHDPALPVRRHVAASGPYPAAEWIRRTPPLKTGERSVHLSEARGRDRAVAAQRSMPSNASSLNQPT